MLSASGEDRLKELVTGQSLEGGRASPCEEVGVEPTMCPEQSRQEFKAEIRKIIQVKKKNTKNVVVALCEKNKINNKTIVQYAIPFIQNIYTIFTRDGKIMGFVQALWLQCHLKVSSLKDNFFEEKR